MCKAEVTGSIPVRSMLYENPSPDFEDGRRRATHHGLVALEPQAQSGFLV